MIEDRTRSGSIGAGPAGGIRVKRPLCAVKIRLNRAVVAEWVNVSINH